VKGRGVFFISLLIREISHSTLPFFNFKNIIMKRQFVQIKDTRIRLSIIKKYKKNGVKGITIYYNSSRNKPESETFYFEDETERFRELEKLDDLLP